MAKTIGYVAELLGEAQVRGTDDIIRVLSLGDQIQEGDVLTTGIGTQILLEFFDGNKLQLGENSEVLLDQTVFSNLQNFPDTSVDQLAELLALDAAPDDDAPDDAAEWEGKTDKLSLLEE